MPIQAPPPCRDVVMRQAMEKDLKKLDRNLQDMCETSLPLIQEICDVLPNKKSLRKDGVPEEVLHGTVVFSKLQRAMANLNQKILVGRFSNGIL